MKNDLPIPNQTTPSDPEALIKEKEAAEFIQVTRRALQNWRITGSGPRYIQISLRCIRYRRRDLIEWAQNKSRCSTSEGV